MAPPCDGEGRHYRYRHPETGHVSHALDWFTWQELIKSHRIGNKLPPVSAEETEDQLCRVLPPEQCERAIGDAPGITTRFGWKEVKAATLAFTRLLTTGFVSKFEAERRARICAGCYFNVVPIGCGTCQKLTSLVTGELAQRRTKSDSLLNGCAVCQCSLKALVHFPLKTLELESKQDRLPSFCWQKQGGENFLPDDAENP